MDHTHVEQSPRGATLIVLIRDCPCGGTRSVVDGDPVTIREGEGRIVDRSWWRPEWVRA